MKNKEQANKRSRQDIIQINGVFRSFEILYQWDFDTTKMGHFFPLIVQSVHLLSAQIFLLWRKEMASFRAAALCFINRRWGRVRQTHFLGAATQFFFNPKISDNGYIFQCLNFDNEIEYPLDIGPTLPATPDHYDNGRFCIFPLYEEWLDLLRDGCQEKNSWDLLSGPNRQKRSFWTPNHSQQVSDHIRWGCQLICLQLELYDFFGWGKQKNCPIACYWVRGEGGAIWAMPKRVTSISYAVLP